MSVSCFSSALFPDSWIREQVWIRLMMIINVTTTSKTKRIVTMCCFIHTIPHAKERCIRRMKSLLHQDLLPIPYRQFRIVQIGLSGKSALKGTFMKRPGYKRKNMAEICLVRSLPVRLVSSPERLAGWISPEVRHQEPKPLKDKSASHAVENRQKYRSWYDEKKEGTRESV